MWQSDLKRKGWPPDCIEKFQFCIAPSTLNTYNGALEKLHAFCQDRGCHFPPSEVRILAEFLATVAEKSARPRSVLNTTTAALGHVYRALDLPNISESYEIRMLITALVKSGTSVPMLRSKVMPVSHFHDLFMNWSGNDALNLRSLRLKAITLLALTAMLRPSDIAPNARQMNSNGECKVVFSVNQVLFSNNDVKITFFGIKNDAARTGFEVQIPRSSNDKIDPVQTLQDYIARTESYRPADGPVFLTLRSPYKALEASSVAKVLEESISLAGLSGQGFSAKSFRPTGATSAIEQGISPEVVRKVGRWKNAEVFFEHYVHARTPDSFSDNVLQHA